MGYIIDTITNITEGYEVISTYNIVLLFFSKKVSYDGRSEGPDFWLTVWILGDRFHASVEL